MAIAVAERARAEFGSRRITDPALGTDRHLPTAAERPTSQLERGWASPVFRT